MKRQDITEEELVSALRSLAVLVDRHGPKYWPIFERLDNELARMKRRKGRLAMALNTSRNTYE